MALSKSEGAGSVLVLASLSGTHLYIQVLGNKPSTVAAVPATLRSPPNLNQPQRDALAKRALCRMVSYSKPCLQRERPYSFVPQHQKDASPDDPPCDFATADLPSNRAEVDVQFQDGNPFDRFVVFNRGCPFADAVITLDFTTSAGGILIDTVYGGPGSRDPMEASLAEGDAVLRQVDDGDQIIHIDVATLPTVSAITVTMDVDDTIGLWEDARVYADGQEISGTAVSISLNSKTIATTLNTTGQGQLTIPTSVGACPMS